MPERTPTLGVCLGGQLLAAATGGTVRKGADGPEIGAYLTAKRDAAMSDPLFADLPMTPDVMQYHHDVVITLPPGAVLLLSSMGYPNQAWRQGPAAWGLQFHLETVAPRRPGVGARRRAAADRAARARRWTTRRTRWARCGGSSRTGSWPSPGNRRPSRRRRRAAAAGGAAMTRPAVRTPAIYGLPDTERVRARPGHHRAVLGVRNHPGFRGHPGRDLPLRPAGARRQRADQAVRGVHQPGRAARGVARCSPGSGVD